VNVDSSFQDVFSQLQVVQVPSRLLSKNEIAIEKRFNKIAQRKYACQLVEDRVSI